MTYSPCFGKIFQVRFPFTDLNSVKLRPALAISEPDQYGDIECVFITTRPTSRIQGTIDVPDGLLPFASTIHCNKRYLLHTSIIVKELAGIGPDLLKTVLKETIKAGTANYYQQIQKPAQNAPFVPGQTRINYAGRVFDEKEMTNLVDSSLDFWLTTGHYAQKFEKDLAEKLGVKFSSLVNSGSSANLLAIMSLTSPKLGERRLCPGDEVITVAAGFPTTVAPILQAGAVPVFVDVRLPDANVNVDLLEQAVSSKTKAVILAHTLGLPFDLKAVKSFCDRHGLWFIEDNCDALGAKYLLDNHWQLTGTIGNIGTSSFYPAHHITMGEGGAVYTNDVTFKRIVESFRDWGRDCWCKPGRDNTCKSRFNQQFGTLPLGYDHKYVYSHFGYNLKVTDMQAAIGCAQLEKLDHFTTKRKANFSRLLAGLEGLSNIFHLPKILPGTDPSPFGLLLTVRDDSGFSRNDLTGFLESRNIQTRNLFAGNITRHPCFNHLEQGKDYRIFGDLQITDKIMNNAFWIGVYPGMTEEMVDYMVQSIFEFVENL